MSPDAFRAFRLRHGLPQAALADALGVSRHLIIEIEQGRATASRQLRLALSAWVAGLPPYEPDPRDLELYGRRPLRVDRRAAPP